MLLGDYAGFLKQLVGAAEVDLTVKVEGGQIGIPFRPHIDLGQPCAHRNLPRIAGQKAR